MSIWRRLRTRLFVSHLLVIAIGGLAMFVVGSVLTRTLFQGRLGRMNRGAGRLNNATAGELHAALGDSLNIALVVGFAVAVLAAGVVAAFLARRFIRPISAVREATDRIARGEYDEEIELPQEEELAALAGDVNTLARTLSATESRRTRLIGEVTHELRSPITTIRALMEGVLDGVTEPTSELFVAVADEASRMQRLADDLALLSQAEEGSLPMVLELADLRELGAGAAERLRLQFDHQQVALEVEPGVALPVSVDPLRIGQVFTNLLGNALIHTPAGGVVAVRSIRESDMAVVEVLDSGSGIQRDELDHIFERFYRLPDSTQPAGRGIGLTIARSIARAHGGDVTADSRGPGQGSTFRISIPLHELDRG
ncbi:MAG: HAMP domain-containing sensor histidine kinase [Acidimicrobiia bacterium]|nr:HAMP domain-containing sensor histidine kinase [Acidimicrobiia bacterium]